MYDYEKHRLDWEYDCYLGDLLSQTGLQQIEDFFFNFAAEYRSTINDFISNSKVISSINQFDMALVSVVCALELLIRFFYLKPLIGGMFLNEDWFDFSYECKMVPDRTCNEKELLKKLLSKHNISSLEEIRVKNQSIWSSLEYIFKTRNGVVHNGKKASEGDYHIAILCYEQLVEALEKVYKSFVILGEKTMKLITDGWEM